MPVHKPQGSSDEILAGISGVLPDFEVFHNQILVGIYMRGAVKDLGNGKVLHLPDKTVDEDQWQGKVGIVLNVGPLAFKNDARNDFGGVEVKKGDWIIFRVSDGFPIDINGIHCRLLEDVHVKGRLTSPDLNIIW